MNNNVSDRRPAGWDDVLREIIRVVDSILTEEGSEPGQVGPETLLTADLGFSSINAVQLAGELQKRFNLQDVSFQPLIYPDDSPVDDLRVSAVADFLWSQIEKR